MKSKFFLATLLLTPILVVTFSTLYFTMGMSPDGTKNNGIFFKSYFDLNDFKIKASKEKVFLISIPSQDVPFILESSFDCNDNTDMGFDFNFIQDDSPPAQTLIAPSSYQKSKNEEDKMAWLSKFCDKNIPQSSLSEKFQIGDFFDENWAKDIDVTCLNKLS